MRLKNTKLLRFLKLTPKLMKKMRKIIKKSYLINMDSQYHELMMITSMFN